MGCGSRGMHGQAAELRRPAWCILVDAHESVGRKMRLRFADACVDVKSS